MDERIEKAFSVANYMSTLAGQKRIILEEYNQQLVHYVNGATFKVGPELVSFVKTLVDLGHTTDVVLVDGNNFPVLIDNVETFLDSIVTLYVKATKQYADKYNDIRIKRKIADIVEL
jgi:hypothetical protein